MRPLRHSLILLNPLLRQQKLVILILDQSGQSANFTFQIDNRFRLDYIGLTGYFHGDWGWQRQDHNLAFDGVLLDDRNRVRLALVVNCGDGKALRGRLRVLRLMLARSVGLIYLALGDGVSHLDRICLVLLV